MAPPWQEADLPYSIFEAAMSVCDAVGLKNFRNHWGAGFAPAKSQHIYAGNRGPYEARSLVAAAYALRYPQAKPLTPKNFGGNDAHQYLQNKGFTLENTNVVVNQTPELPDVVPDATLDLTGISNLEKNTQDFFHIYWNKNHIGIDAPKWNDWLCINGVLGEAPPEIRGKAGCYAIYQGSDLLYIGVAVTEGKDFLRNGGPRYGLINRLRTHVIYPESFGSQRFVPLDVPNKRWNSITCIRWIVFPDEHRHLAAALEVYLIKRNKTKYNSEWKDIS